MKNELRKINLQLFADLNPNATTDSGMSPGIKTFYEKELIMLAKANLPHDQFAQKKPIPRHSGQNVEFRKWNPLPKALSVLQEGVTPDGQKLSIDTLEAVVHQYGGYTTLTDMLELTHIDDTIVQATKLIAQQAAETLDTVTRDILCGGTNVQYAEGQVTSRANLAGGLENGNMYLTVNAVRMAVRTLKGQNAPKINGSYVAIIHPDVAYDLMSDPAWQNVKDYDPADWYAGEIGRIAGVRFVESTEAKIFKASNLTAESLNLTEKSTVPTKNTVIAVSEKITPEDAFKLGGRQVLINSGSEVYTILRATPGAAGDATIELDKAVATTTGHTIAPVGGGKSGRAVYVTLVLGADAYGVTEIEGGGLEHIVKQKGSAGTADPLNQRATIGWKATKAAERLVEQYMVRIETCSSSDSPAN